MPIRRIDTLGIKPDNYQRVLFNSDRFYTCPIDGHKIRLFCSIYSEWYKTILNATFNWYEFYIQHTLATFSNTVKIYSIRCL